MVVAVVTYGTSPPYGPPLVRNFSSPGQQTRRSARRTIGYLTFIIESGFARL